MDKLVKKIYDPHRGNLRGTHRMGGPIFRSLKLNPLSQKFTYLAKTENRAYSPTIEDLMSIS